jgi:hypothetical protein
MTLVLEIPPELESALAAQAQAQGLLLQQYIERLLRDQVPQQGSRRLSPAELAAAWRESVEGLPQTPPLSDEAISRESIYGERG